MPPSGQTHDPAVVAVSGGLDSCVAAAVTAQTAEPAVLHATYGQRTARRERKAFDDIADFYGVPGERRLVADLSWLSQIGGSSLTDPSRPVPPPGTPGVPDTYVPFRNSHLICIAVSWAEVIGATRVVLGAVEQDSSGYPDCREAYFKAAQAFVDAGTRPDTDISVDAPLLAMRKADIVRKGIELGAPLHLTWSCYRSEDRPCGRCDSCVLRREAFEAADVPDPAEGQAAGH